MAASLKFEAWLDDEEEEYDDEDPLRPSFALGPSFKLEQPPWPSFELTAAKPQGQASSSSNRHGQASSSSGIAMAKLQARGRHGQQLR
ncbi:hypothetical protein NL676_010006 [Syzygium grande]|nr:hypothetical protein NL676_010006 [Syzygium grande]